LRRHCPHFGSSDFGSQSMRLVHLPCSGASGSEVAWPYPPAEHRKCRMHPGVPDVPSPFALLRQPKRNKPPKELGASARGAGERRTMIVLDRWCARSYSTRSSSDDPTPVRAARRVRRRAVLTPQPAGAATATHLPPHRTAELGMCALDSASPVGGTKPLSQRRKFAIGVQAGPGVKPSTLGGVTPAFSIRAKLSMSSSPVISIRERFSGSSARLLQPSSVVTATRRPSRASTARIRASVHPHGREIIFASQPSCSCRTIRALRQSRKMSSSESVRRSVCAVV
jgi:hypothetical protein